MHLPYVFKTRRSIEDSHRFGLPTLARSVVDDADLWPDRIDQHLCVGTRLAMMRNDEQIDHTGDIGLEIYGQSLEELYENAGYAYFDVICDMDTVELKEKKEVVVTGKDRAELLRNLLVELLYISQVDLLLFKKFTVKKLDESGLTLEVEGEDIDEERHLIEIEIKAITYHMLEVKQKEDGSWGGLVILDI